AELGVDDDVVGVPGAALIVEAAAGHRVLDVRADLGVLDRRLEARILGADHPKHRVEVGLLREEVDEHVAGDRADPVDILGPGSAAPTLGARATAEAAADHDPLAGRQVDRILAGPLARLDGGAAGLPGLADDHAVVHAHR